MRLSIPFTFRVAAEQKKATRVEVNILLAFLHWVGMALHPWHFVSDIAIFVLKKGRYTPTNWLLAYFMLQYLGYRTNAVSFEVDDRYRRFGFEIEDTPGRCRILRHHALGSRPFVGCVFTTAPVTNPLVASLTVDQQPATLTSDKNDNDGGEQW